ncbi:Caseinolytic peptidase B protein, partial [Clarias magur]
MFARPNRTRRLFARPPALRRRDAGSRSGREPPTAAHDDPGARKTVSGRTGSASWTRRGERDEAPGGEA